MAKKKLKLTDGVLCRDSSPRGGCVSFCRGIKPKQLDFTGGWADCEDSEAKDWRAWSPEMFDRIYGLKQAPKPGKKFECEMEL